QAGSADVGGGSDRDRVARRRPVAGPLARDARRRAGRGGGRRSCPIADGRSLVRCPIDRPARGQAVVPGKTRFLTARRRPPGVALAASGFPLVGGRLDYLGGRPVAALVYQRRKHVINLFVCPDSSGVDGAPSSRGAYTRRGFHVRYWTRDGMSFWAVSDVNEI